MGITRGILNAISGSEIDPSKVTTDDLVNAPVLALQEYRLIAETLSNGNEFATTSNGSGSTSAFAGKSFQVASGTTGDSFVVAEHQSAEAKDLDGFNRKLVFKVVVEFNTIGGAAGDQMYAALAPSKFAEDTYTTEHIGVGTLAGDVVATTADGTTQNTTAIVSGASTGSRILWAVYDPDTPKVDFYEGTEPPAASSPDATHTSNLPSTSEDNRQLNISADNDSNANENKLRISEWGLGVGE